MSKSTGPAQGLIATLAMERRAAPGSETPHAFLRRVTQPWHDRVEGAFTRFDLQTVEGLSDFLRRQALALLPLEQALETAGVEKLLPDWSLRRRAARLADDLAWLGHEAPTWDALPHLRSPEHMMGALYVLEGSKLGGRVLYRRVMLSPDSRVRGAAAFLAHRYSQEWATFLRRLDAMAAQPGAFESLRQGAEAAFALFHAAAERDLPRLAAIPTRFGLDCHAHA